MNHENIYYDFYFKLEYTNKIIHYLVYSNYLVKNFIYDMKKIIRDDFKINNDEDIEFIEFIESFKTDNKKLLDSSGDITLRQFYKNICKKRRFYVRVTQLSFKIDIKENSEIEYDNIRLNYNDKILGPDNV